MKKLIWVLLCLAVVPFAWADELKIKKYIKLDPLREDNNYLIYNKHGKATGRISTSSTSLACQEVWHLQCFCTARGCVS
jgi:hypothetical protein